MHLGSFVETCIIKLPEICLFDTSCKIFFFQSIFFLDEVLNVSATSVHSGCECIVDCVCEINK